MKHTYLEVTFRKGKALAAYYYLPRDSKDRSVRTEAVGSGLLVDYSEDDRPIGIEITSPGTLEPGCLTRHRREASKMPMDARKATEHAAVDLTAGRRGGAGSLTQQAWVGSAPQQMAREISGRKLAELNRVLQELGQSPLAPEEITPLSAA